MPFFVGHTMATPDIPVEQAIALFAGLGCRATELVCMTAAEQGERHGPAIGDAPIPSHEWSPDRMEALATHARRAGAPILTVTQYIKTFNSPVPEDRRWALDQVSRSTRFAARLGARFVRVHGGADGYGPESWSQAVMSLRKLCRTAEAAGIVLLIENHPGTLTVTGMDTARMVADVASPTLRVLYDPANVLCHSAEDAWHTFEVQKEVIAYVHVKDFRIDGGERVACPVGQGCVPWAEIIAWIRAARRDVPFSLEYERKWNRTQLPPPEIGLAASLAHLRTLLCQTPGAGVG